MEINRVLSLLGIAAKAGKLSSGEFSVEKSIQTRKAFMVIVAEDASANTKKKFDQMCFYYKIPFYVFSNREILGKAVGKQTRVSLAVLDEGLSEAIIGKLNTAN